MSAPGSPGFSCWVSTAQNEEISALGILPRKSRSPSTRLEGCPFRGPPSCHFLALKRACKFGIVFKMSSFSSRLSVLIYSLTDWQSLPRVFRDDHVQLRRHCFSPFAIRGDRQYGNKHLKVQ